MVFAMARGESKEQPAVSEEQPEEQPAGPCLLERFGGVDNVIEMVNLGYDALLSDKEISIVFSQNNFERLKDRTVEFLVGEWGGKAYRGEGLFDAHAGLKVSERQYTLTMKTFAKGLKKMKTDKALAKEIMDQLEEMRGPIVDTNGFHRRELEARLEKARILAAEKTGAGSVTDACGWTVSAETKQGWENERLKLEDQKKRMAAQKKKREAEARKAKEAAIAQAKEAEERKRSASLPKKGVKARNPSNPNCPPEKRASNFAQTNPASVTNEILTLKEVVMRDADEKENTRNSLSGGSVSTTDDSHRQGTHMLPPTEILPADMHIPAGFGYTLCTARYSPTLGVEATESRIHSL
jgi:truncated hemoglobin YjbI